MSPSQQRYGKENILSTILLPFTTLRGSVYYLTYLTLIAISGGAGFAEHTACPWMWSHGSGALP